MPKWIAYWRHSSHILSLTNNRNGDHEKIKFSVRLRIQHLFFRQSKYTDNRNIQTIYFQYKIIKWSNKKWTFENSLNFASWTCNDSEWKYDHIHSTSSLFVRCAYHSSVSCFELRTWTKTGVSSDGCVFRSGSHIGRMSINFPDARLSMSPNTNACFYIDLTFTYQKHHLNTIYVCFASLCECMATSGISNSCSCSSLCEFNEQQQPLVNLCLSRSVNTMLPRTKVDGLTLLFTLVIFGVTTVCGELVSKKSKVTFVVAATCHLESLPLWIFIRENYDFFFHTQNGSPSGGITSSAPMAIAAPKPKPVLQILTTFTPSGKAVQPAPPARVEAPIAATSKRDVPVVMTPPLPTSAASNTTGLTSLVPTPTGGNKEK